MIYLKLFNKKPSISRLLDEIRKNFKIDLTVRISKGIFFLFERRLVEEQLGAFGSLEGLREYLIDLSVTESVLQEFEEQ